MFDLLIKTTRSEKATSISLLMFTGLYTDVIVLNFVQLLFKLLLLFDTEGFNN